MLQIAKILKSNGTNGALLVGVRDAVIYEISPKEPVLIYFDGLLVPFFIQDIQAKGLSKAVIKLNDIDCLKDAEEVVGREIYIEAECEQEQEEDFTGWTLCCRGEEVGTITGMELIPGNPCLYLGDTLIPLNEELIIGCDIEEQVLDMDLPEGLL